MSVKLQTEHHLEFLGLTGGCTGSSEYTNVKIPHCWKSSIMAHLLITRGLNLLSFPGKNIVFKILFFRHFYGQFYIKLSKVLGFKLTLNAGKKY